MVNAKAILEKHWRKYRLDIGLEYEPMSERAIESMVNAMHDFAVVQGVPDLIGKSQGDIAQIVVVHCIRFMDNERRIAVIKKLAQSLSKEEREQVVEWVDSITQPTSNRREAQNEQR